MSKRAYNRRKIGKIKKHTMRKDGHIIKKEYWIWQKMIQRCANVNDGKYHIYGARGIKVCKRWLQSFDNFYFDMGPKPIGKSIDRIRVNGNYTPKNCKWSTPKEQAHNTRYVILYEHNYQKNPLSEWAKIFNIPMNTLWHRINKQKMPFSKAINK